MSQRRPASSAAAGAAAPHGSITIATARLDPFVAGYVEYDLKNAPYCGYGKEGHRMYRAPQQFDGASNLLYHNNGDGTFAEALKRGACGPQSLSAIEDEIVGAWGT